MEETKQNYGMSPEQRKFRRRYYLKQRLLGVISLTITIIILAFNSNLWPIACLTVPVGWVFIMSRKPIWMDICLTFKHILD